MTQQADYDSPWKEILEHYLPEFPAFFFPNIYAEVDWHLGYEFLEQELQQVVRDAETGARRVDKLVKVWRVGGNEFWVLIHLEVQGQKDTDFSERIYIYNYRIVRSFSAENGKSGCVDRRQSKVAAISVWLQIVGYRGAVEIRLSEAAGLPGSLGRFGAGPESLCHCSYARMCWNCSASSTG